MKNNLGFCVSRETISALEHLLVLLRKWNPKINLVSQTSIRDAWSRHIIDSAQIFEITDKPFESWVDMGSGAGFPGLVAGVLSKEFVPKARVSLIESDSRKCVFMRTAVRELDLDAEVINARIEEAKTASADIVSARALASLSDLFSYGTRHINRTGIMIFPKGETWETEILDARRLWKFDYEVTKSRTNANSVIISAKGVERV